MSDKHLHTIPKVGSAAYKKFIKTEVEQYAETYSDGLKEKVPPSWDKVERHFKEQIERKTGFYGFAEYVADCARKKKKVSIYSIGSGACGVEIEDIAPLLKKYKVEYTFLCTDINPIILKKAEAEAKKQGVNLKTKVVDANLLKLPENEYDIIIAYASLHHFIDLESVMKEINKALKNDGFFVTVDIPTRNGFMMWEATYALVRILWMILPPKYRISHTRSHKPVYVKWLDNMNYGQVSFECIHSESVIPSLRKNLIEVEYVPALSIMRRFFDTQYGPNYDFRRRLDRSIFKAIRLLDTCMIDTGLLKPETFFGSYKKR